MELKELQERVGRFVRENGMECGLETRMLDLLCEAGECAKELLKTGRYGKCPPTPGEAWAEEIADLLFSLLCLAESSGVDLEKSLLAVLDKYQARIAASGQAGSGR